MLGRDIQQTIAQAVQLHQAGRFAEAERLYREALAVAPGRADLLHLLGLLVGQMGRLDEAVELISRTIAVDPNDAIAHSNLGKLLNDTGRHERAAAVCRRAIELDPKLPDAFNNLGNALADQSPEEAAAAYRQALAIDPHHAAACNNLGALCTRDGEFLQAAELFRRAARAAPGYADAHSNLSAALIRLKQFAEAAEAARAAIRCDPGFVGAHVNLSGALLALHRSDQALAAARQAVAIAPSNPETSYHFAMALTESGMKADAVTAYRRAIELDPRHADSHNNLGNLLRQQGDPDAALDAYRNAITLDARSAAAAVYYNNVGSVTWEMGRIGAAMCACRRAVELDPGFSAAYNNLAYFAHFHPQYDGHRILQENVKWAERFERPVHSIAPIQRQALATSPRRLRIAYLSPDLRQHSVGRFLLPLLAHHDRTSFEITCYSDVSEPDETTKELRLLTDRWRDTRTLSDQQLVDQIRADQIDMLVDLTLHMAGSRLGVFARRAAPVQVSWLGYAGTSGLAAMDWRISDPHLDPADAELPYTERTMRVPSYWCYRPMEVAPDVSELPALVLGHATFASLHNFAKVNTEMLILWAALLRRVENARLLIHCRSRRRQRQCQALFTAHGIDEQRIQFVGHQSPREYFHTYQLVDIALDPTPYAGGTTTCDALWMGVPVVTLRGRTAVARGGVSILSQLGLTDLIGETSAQYLDIAAGLANDSAKLANLRGSLRERMKSSRLMDEKRYAAELESAYRRMWDDGGR
jgi:predicted O-linked N-acetylglucosamine transferase (SPINDLY family)